MKKEERILTEVMTTEEASQYLKTSKQSLIKLAREGKVKANRIGRNYRFAKKELDKFVEGGSEN